MPARVVSRHGGRPLLLVATRNPGKLREFGELLAELPYDLVDLKAVGVPAGSAEDSLEAWPTFEENALAKAQYFHAASGGLPTVADDSGLVVPELGGAPGVRSRRWAGATGSELEVASANNRKLVAELSGALSRAAAFVCVLAYVDQTRALVVRGEVRGSVAEAARGAHGFGYDPLFEPDELPGRTFAEIGPAEKASVSHRARAALALRRALTDLSAWRVG